MKVSGFTFLRNGQKLGYPFVASIRSVLPIVDEFVVALGAGEDETEKLVREIGDPKIRIIPTQWNERIRSDYSVKGYVYGQQKSIALFNCTGDWAFYLEGDELVHEDELPKIRAAMERYLDDPRVEALAFDYLHFYGNANTYAWSPRWYRTEARILRNTIPAWGPEGMFFVVLETHKRGRYPRAAHTARRFTITAGSRACRNGPPSGSRTSSSGARRGSLRTRRTLIPRCSSRSPAHTRRSYGLAAAGGGSVPGQPQSQTDLPGAEAPPDAAPGEVVRLPVPQEALQAGGLRGEWRRSPAGSHRDLNSPIPKGWLRIAQGFNPGVWTERPESRRDG